MRILLADDQPKVRSALRLLLEEEGLDVVGEASDAEQALEQTAEREPDLVLLDWELPGQGGPAAVAGLRDAQPGVLVVALSGRPGARQAALDAGADAFVSKGEPPERLLAVVMECRHRVHE